MKITKIEVHVVGPEDERYTWSEDIEEVYQSNTLIKVYTDEDIVGEAAVWNATYFEYDKSVSYTHLTLPTTPYV